MPDSRIELLKLLQERQNAIVDALVDLRSDPELNRLARRALKHAHRSATSTYAHILSAWEHSVTDAGQQEPLL